MLGVMFVGFAICLSLLAEPDAVFDMAEAETGCHGWQVSTARNWLCYLGANKDRARVAATALFLRGPQAYLPPIVWFLLKTTLCILISVT
jgi:NADH:ubiquinone oxidoreductase subunit H